MKICTTLSVAAAAAALFAPSGTVLAKDFNQLLNGQYAFTGEATCLTSLDGFNPDLTPLGPPARFPFIISFSVEGIRTFNGDGTGSLVGRVLSIRHPSAIPSAVATPYTPSFNRGSAIASHISATFTYTVAPDMTVEIHNSSFNGTNVAGNPPGPTFTITDFPVFVGLIGKDYKTLTLAHLDPAVESQTYFNASNVPVQTHYRVCHRSRVLLERKND